MGGDNPIVSSVATSNRDAAAVAAEKFFEAIKADIAASDKYVVGVIQHDETQTGIDRAPSGGPGRTTASSFPPSRAAQPRAVPRAPAVRARTAAHRVPARRLQAGTAPARPAGPSSAGPKVSRPGRRQTEPPASATKISACARRSNSRSGTRCGGKNARNAA